MEEKIQNTRQQPPVRRKRKRRPKWQRVLRKYWPPIRFGLICLLLLVILITGVKGIVGLVRDAVRDDDVTQQTDPAQDDTEPTEDQIAKDVQELIKEADFLAAGYDYEAAVALIQSDPSYGSSEELDARIAEYRDADAKLVSYPKMNEITHVFFHTLVVDEERCFDGDYREKGYNLYMTTVDEFNQILESMYERGYVLVSPYDVAYEVTDESGTHFKYGDIRLPAGTTPFVMSQDDVNYYGYMIGDEDPQLERPAVANAGGDGFAHKIIIGEDG